MSSHTLTLYNTLTRRKEAFQPIDPATCACTCAGRRSTTSPTSAMRGRSSCSTCCSACCATSTAPTHVTYARNITDVDDKINARAAERYPGLPPIEAIRKLTAETTAQFHADIAALGVLPPTVEPRATDHIAEMRALCEALVAQGPRLRRPRTTCCSTSRRWPTTAASPTARSRRWRPAPASTSRPTRRGRWTSCCGSRRRPAAEAGAGRARAASPRRAVPAGIIECSAMAEKHLGQVFDIHAGGIDLVFPHHENEVAQIRCAHGTPVMANVWMHNGFLQVEGEKMSKSLGNFITINELLATQNVRRPALAWPRGAARHARHALSPADRLDGRAAGAGARDADRAGGLAAGACRRRRRRTRMCVAALGDDLNTPSAISIIHGLAKSARAQYRDAPAQLKATLQFLGLYGGETRRRSQRRLRGAPRSMRREVEELIAARNRRAARPRTSRRPTASATSWRRWASS